ncbi:glutamyl-tRNA reductase [Bacillus kwashiorkori]|uniref:glutamyl-tRNA reductase n=1 Tax=Bacillus kwashiorkori TaxID=1522318 RepID=UPI0007829DA4|nr:glutamyl-tRNA reductase [Bacillus kwashiorkori]
MHILAVGLNYKTAPVEIRERLSFNETLIGENMLLLKQTKSILENVIISTCNRTEIYAVVDQIHTGKYYIKEFLAKTFGISREEFEQYLFIYENDLAIRHLFRVTCGLDSMILGETQILGQVRTSFFTAQKHHTVGTVFNQLFKQAITVAKKAHTETEIAANAVSVSYAAVELAKKVFGNLKEKKILIIGAGKMGELTLENLAGSGANNITIINRTYEKASALAVKFSGVAKPFEEIQKCLAETDIVISSTGASQYIITEDLVEDAVHYRKGEPILFVDIAVPRDIHPNIGTLNSVFLYDIDDLEGIVQANLQERERAAIEIDNFLTVELVAFKQWLNTLGVVPLISALRENALQIQANTMESLDRKLPNLTERERKVIGKHMKSIINQMLREPILQIKEMANEENGDVALHLFKQIFNLQVEEEDNYVQNPKSVKDNTVTFELAKN